MSDDERENVSSIAKKRTEKVLNRRKSSEKSNKISLRKHSNALSKNKDDKPESTLPITENIAHQMDYSLLHFSEANHGVSNFRSDICFRRSMNGIGIEVECVKRILRENNVIQSPADFCEPNLKKVPDAGLFNSRSDVELSKRLVCEKHVQDLQEKLLTAEQEVAAVKLKYHQTEKQLTELQEVLQNVGTSWPKMEDAIKHLQEENSRNKEQVKNTNEKNELLQEQLSLLENKKTTLQKLSEQTSFSTQLRITHLEKSEETLQRQLTTEQEASLKYQEDLQNLRKQLFQLQQEIQVMNCLKLEQERDTSIKMSAIRQALEEEKRSVRKLTTEKEIIQGQLDELSLKCTAMQKEHHSAQEEKDSVVIEFRRSEAQKVAQEYEHAASLQKVVNQLQKELDRKVSEQEQVHKQELQQMLAVTQHHVDEMKKNYQQEINNMQKSFAELLIQKENNLKDVASENQRLHQKFEELETGRSRLLSKLQVHLQNQWVDAVEILYSVSNPTTEIKDAQDLSPVKHLPSKQEDLQVKVSRDISNKVSQQKIDEPSVKELSMNHKPYESTPYSINISKTRSKLTPSPITTSSTPLSSGNHSKALSRLCHSGFTLSPTLRLEDFGLSTLSPVVSANKGPDPTKLQQDMSGSFTSSKGSIETWKLIGVKDTVVTDLKSPSLNLEKLNLDEVELSMRNQDGPEVRVFNDRSQKLQRYINKLLHQSPSTTSSNSDVHKDNEQQITPEQDKPHCG